MNFPEEQTYNEVEISTIHKIYTLIWNIEIFF